MSTNSTPILSGSWRQLPPEAKVHLLEKLRARRSTSLELTPLHPSQAQVAKEAKRFNVLVCGRRWGKTTLAINRLVQPALKGFPVAYFAPTYKMMSDVWRDLKEALINHTVRVSEQDHRIEVTGGGMVDMWSLDSANSVRGRKYKRIVVDEAAMVKDLENAWNAVIRPTLTDYQGDAWFPSTPMGMGYFRRMYDFGQDEEQPEWASWRIPSVTNTTIPGLPEEIEAARRDMPERIFAQEYLAEFLDDSGGVFRKVMEAATAEKQDEAIEGHQYVIGIDWGKHQDFTVFTVLDTTTKEVVYIDRSNKVDYILQRGRLGVLADQFKTKTLIPEANSIGEPNIEELKRSGFKVHPFHTTNTSKAEAVDALSLAFERGDVKIIKDTTLISELLAYEAERLPSGLLRYSAPAGMHDDCVMSLMMAWSAVASPPRKILYA